MLRKLFGGGGTAASAGPVTVQEAERLVAHGDAVLIDVREQGEWEAGHVRQARHIPLGVLPDRLAEVPHDRAVLLFCRSGNRSGQATRLLLERGFTNARNVDGGVLAWERQGLPLEQGR